MDATSTWLLKAATVVVLEAALAAALVLAVLAKKSELEAKAVAALAVAQAAACSPDRAVKAAQVKEPKAVR